MDLAAVITRIRAQCSAVFSTRVAGASELAAAQRESDALAKPSAWVIPAEERAIENRVELGAFDRIEEGFGVVVAVDNTADERGQASSVAVDTIRDSLRTGLLGWVVDADHLPTQYARGDLVAIDRSTLWYEFGFVSVRTGGKLVEWSVKAVLYLATTSAATALTALAAKLVTTLGATRLLSDVSEGRQVIAQGSTVFRMIPAVTPWVIDSNEIGSRLAVELIVTRHLGSAEAERTYTEGNMLTQQLAILGDSYWETSDDAEVRPDERPELAQPSDPTT